MDRKRMVPGEWGALAAGRPRTPAQIESTARQLLGQLSLEEKIGQMSGDEPYIPGLLRMAHAYNREPVLAGENLRLEIPGIRFSDGPRGAVIYHSTCFPVSMSRGASWDTELEERIGDAIGVEARAQGANLVASVCINLLRHPAWGRAQETFGEDPHHLGVMGAAQVRGIQRHVMACVKHFALNSIENVRFSVDVQVGERALREVYLPHFKRCVDEGAAAVMSAYNRVNGSYCGHNRHLLREILKDEWGFDGFVMSDFVFGMSDARLAALAGLDLEMPLRHYYWRDLRRLVESGEVPLDLIDDAVLRLLRQKVRFAQVGEPGRYDPGVVAGEAHRALARQAAAAGMVLLQNNPVGHGALLPIDVTRVRRLALIGELAGVANLGDHGSSQVRPPSSVSLLEGLQAALGKDRVFYDNGRRAGRAADLAARCDVAVVVAGCNYFDEGEFMPNQRGGSDRRSLRLHAQDERLIGAVAAANPACLVVLEGGSAFITEGWRAQVPAILVAWYPGMEGGHALADVIFGRAEPGGRLPCSFPRREEQLPFFDRHARSIRYDLYHGYRLAERLGEAPAFAFGYGLGYTRWVYRNLRVEVADTEKGRIVQAKVEVENAGPRPGAEVVQIYAGYENSTIERPVKELKGFKRIRLAPGEICQVELEMPVERLAYFDENSGQWKIDEAPCTIYAGSSSRRQDLLKAPPVRVG